MVADGGIGELAVVATSAKRLGARFLRSPKRDGEIGNARACPINGKLLYFVGMSFNEACAALSIAVSTAKQWWAYARAWLAERTEPIWRRAALDVSKLGMDDTQVVARLNRYAN